MSADCQNTPLEVGDEIIFCLKPVWKGKILEIDRSWLTVEYEGTAYDYENHQMNKVMRKTRKFDKNVIKIGHQAPQPKEVEEAKLLIPAIPT